MLQPSIWICPPSVVPLKNPLSQLFFPTTLKILSHYQTCSSCPQSHPLQSQRRWSGYRHCQLLWLKSDQQCAFGWSHFPPHFLCCWTVSEHPGETEKWEGRREGPFKSLLLPVIRQEWAECIARGRLLDKGKWGRKSRPKNWEKNLIMVKDLMRRMFLY